MVRKLDTEFSRNIGRRVRSHREKLGISRKELANRAYLSERDVTRLEDGGSTSIVILRRLAQELGISPEVLVETFPIDYHSVFLSYGGPDESIGRRFYEAFSAHGIRCFFFPVSAVPGVRLHRTMSEGVNEYDRVVLLCSQNSLYRAGFLNELEQVLVREAREGGKEILIPVALDNHVFEEWAPERADLAKQLQSRVVADFRGTAKSETMWSTQFARVVQALRKVSREKIRVR